jgi:hypothetical protein
MREDAALIEDSLSEEAEGSVREPGRPGMEAEGLVAWEARVR